MRTLPRRSLLAATLLPLLVLFGCGGGYILEGSVVRGSMGIVMLVETDDSRLAAQPLPGARIRAIRDPGKLSSKELGSAIAGPDGSFSLEIDSVGAGLLKEDWLIVVSRSGTSGAEGSLSLPRNPDSKRLLVTLAPGTAAPTSDRWGTTSDDLMRDYERYR